MHMHRKQNPKIQIKIEYEIKTKTTYHYVTKRQKQNTFLGAIEFVEGPPF